MTKICIRVRNKNTALTTRTVEPVTKFFGPLVYTIDRRTPPKKNSERWRPERGPVRKSSGCIVSWRCFSAVLRYVRCDQGFGTIPTPPQRRPNATVPYRRKASKRSERNDDRMQPYRSKKQASEANATTTGNASRKAAKQFILPPG